MCSPKLMLLIIIILVVIAVLCTMGIVIVVISKGGHNTADPPSEKGGTGPSPSVAASGQNSPSDPTTTQPSKSNSPSRSSTGYTSTTTSSEMSETRVLNIPNGKTEVYGNKSTQTKTVEEDSTTMLPSTTAPGNDKERNIVEKCCNFAPDNETIIQGLKVFPPSSKFGSLNSHASVTVGFGQYDLSSYCESNCSTYTRTYLIPFKRELSTQDYIFEINSTRESVLLDCTGKTSNQKCPGMKVPQDKLTDQRRKKTHEWKVYFSRFHHISYHLQLHIAPTADKVQCRESSGSNGPGIHYLYFRFIRNCK